MKRKHGSLWNNIKLIKIWHSFTFPTQKWEWHLQNSDHVTNPVLCCMLYLVVQSCPILWPHGLQPSRLLWPWRILQARILEWLAMPSSRGSSQPRNQTQVSHTGRWNLYLLSRQGTLHWFPVVPYLGLDGFFPVWLYLRLKLHTDLSSVSWAWQVLSSSLLPSGLCTISSICIGFLSGTSHWFFLISGLSSDTTSSESPSPNCHIKSTLL